MNTPPNPEEAIVDAALEIPAHERAAYLDKLCGHDRELRDLVDALLHAHKKIIASEMIPVQGLSRALAGSASPEERDAQRLAPGVQTMVLSVAPIEKPGDHIGRYKLLEQVGEGGFGVVYVAEQCEPVKRRVALKIVKLGMDTRQVVARFEAERQALALMDHPNIAKVFDGGATAAGRPYFVMELVRGIRITDYCDQNNLLTIQRLELFIQICRAIQHAHQKGIIHRDIKPSNILVTLHDGVPVPKVIDFGIAKATQQELTEKTVYTQLHQFIGTPAYMSPEQAEMSGLDIDTRSDIYSLGVLLYELLTGKTPFDGKMLIEASLDEVRRIIREQEPARPSTRISALTAEEQTTVARRRQMELPKLVSQIRGDLDWIVMKCLEKDRARRCDTANDLASDIQRYLNNEPVTARPPSQLYRFQKLLRRNKLAFAAASAIAAALVIGLGLSTWLFLKERRTRQRAETAERDQTRQRQRAEAARASELRMRQDAEAQTLAARRKAYASDMKLLQVALAAGELDRAQELLNRHRPQLGEEDLRGWEWRYFWQFCQGDEAFTLCKRSNSIHSVSFSGDGNLLAVGGIFPNEVTIWDVGKRQLLSSFEDLEDLPGSRISFAPNSDTLAFYNASNRPGNIVLWDARSGKEMHRLPAAAYVKSLAFSGDGRLFTADIRRSNNVTIWDPVQGKSITSFTANLGNVAVMNCPFLAISRDGNRFADIALGFVQVTDANGRSHRPFRVADEDTTALEFSPDGETLVTAGAYAERTIKLWDVRTRQLLGSLEGHRAWVSCLKFLPDGKTLASASADRTVRLWNFESRQPIRTLRGHGGELWTIDVSPDGRWLAGGGKDGSVILWDLTASTNRPAEYRIPQDGTSRSWGYSPHGRLLALEKSGRLRFYDPTTFQLISEPALPLTNIYAFAFSPDMRWLLATGNGGTNGGTLVCWDVQEQRMVTNFAARLSTRFAFNGGTVLTHDFRDPVTEWNVSTWKQIRQWPVFTNDCWTFSSAAQLLGIAYRDGLCALIPIHDPDKPRRFKGQSGILSVTLSPDGKTFAAASQIGTVELWDTETLTRRALLSGALHGFYSVMISPDGQRVAAGSSGRDAIKVWDLHVHEEVATLAGEQDGSHFLSGAFSPDGNTIGASNTKGRIHFWTAPTWKQIEEAESRKKTAQ